LLAWLIDNAILWVIGLVLLFLLAGSTNLAEASSSSILSALGLVTALAVIAVNLLLQFLYFGYFWSSGGQTLGMKMMNVRVQREDGTAVSFLRGGLRGTLGYYISSFLFFMGFWWALFDSNNETWHDKLFDTRVYNNRWTG
jgi:uncharacterized RDD family membrane protein YckC